MAMCNINISSHIFLTIIKVKADYTFQMYKYILNDQSSDIFSVAHK